MSSFRAWGCEGLEKVELSERRFMERGAQCSLQSEGGTEGTKSWSAGYRATSPHLSGKRARFPAPSPSLPLTQRWKGRRRGSCCFHERAIKAICSLSDAHLPKCRGKRELRREWKFDSKFKIPQKVRGVRGRAGLYHAMRSSVIGQFRFHVYFPERAKPHSPSLLLHTIYLLRSQDLLGKRKRGKKADIKRSLPSRTTRKILRVF